MGILISSGQSTPCKRADTNERKLQTVIMPNADHPLSEVVYTPESRLRHPLQLFQEMGRDLLASRELAWRLMVRDISAQYRQSFLGIFWAFVPPIVTAAGLTLASNAKSSTLAPPNYPTPPTLSSA